MTIHADLDRLSLAELMVCAKQALNSTRSRQEIAQYQEALAKHVDGRRHSSTDEQVRELGAALLDLRASLATKIYTLAVFDQAESQSRPANLPQTPAYPQEGEMCTIIVLLILDAPKP